MKIAEIYKLYNDLASIREKKIPIRMSFIINRNVKKMDEIVSDLEAKRDELVKKYGEKDGDGNIKYADNGSVAIIDRENFMNEYTEIMATDIDITFDKLAMDDIEKCDTDPAYDKLSVAEVGALEIMVGDCKA